MTAATAAERPPRAGVAAPEARLGSWTGHQLNPRRNSLNAIRLVLALAVLLHHTYPLGGFEGHPTIGGVSLGAWAVYSFFVLSGYLITGSRDRLTLGPYLVARAGRILPAFWVCLVVTALLLAPADYIRAEGTLDGFLTQPGTTPAAYIWMNAGLEIRSYSIGTTLGDTPYPSAWNGSLWTLYYEFLCYLLVGVLGAAAWWRRSILAAATAFGVALLFKVMYPSLVSYIGEGPDPMYLADLLPFFLAGALVYRLRGSLPLDLKGAIGALALVIVSLDLLPGWGLHAAAPALAYLILAIGALVPSHQALRTHDLSYGVYIYAFPAQQLLAAFALPGAGIVVYTLASTVGALLLAAASWFWVERPTMARTRAALRGARNEALEARSDAA